MSVVEDTRKLIQDFLAPELRTITARLDAIEDKISANERRAEERQQATLLAINNLANYQAVLDRVAKLEGQTRH